MPISSILGAPGPPWGSSINPVPTGVIGFGAQFPPGPGLDGSFKTVQFAMSHGAMDNRPVAEMITKGPRNDFNIVPNNGWHTAPTMTFPAPANQWTDLNGTPVGHAKINVNRPAIYSGTVTLTAKDSVLTAREQTTTIRFQAAPPPAAP